MILKSLTDLYEALSAEGKIEKVGWSRAKISFSLVLDLQGNLLQVMDIREEKQRGKKTVFLPQEMSLPSPVKRSSGVAANFLWDSASYLLGADEKGKPERSRKCFEAARKKHEALLKNVEDDLSLIHI